MIAKMLLPRFVAHLRLKRWTPVIFGFLWATLILPQTGSAQVAINEFLADNGDGLRTQAGDAADWIELANTGSQPVDISGWHLTDDPFILGKWRVPDGTVIPAGGYLVVFADSSLVALTNSELHANFSLARESEFLALVQPDAVTLADSFSPSYPPQLRDVSYGRGTPPERELVGASTPLRYRVPNADGTGSWNAGTGTLGFSGTNGAFTVRYYEMRDSIGDVDVAEVMVADRSFWRSGDYPIVGTADTIDFHANSASGSFLNDVLFPGHTSPGEDRDRFVLTADGSINVPSAGLWTFCVGSDDGFRLRITGHGVEFVSEYAGGRSFGTTLATFNFPQPGIYDLHLIYYENGGGASVEFSAAKDFQAQFSTEQFHLTGDPAGGILHAGAIGSLVETDVLASMKDINSRLDAEWTFTMDAAPAPGDVLTLYVRCADGFVASLNGTKVAELNAPASTDWNSQATATRSPEDALQWLVFTVPASLLVAGNNTLTLAALNNALGDADFLIAPRLGWTGAEWFPAYFKQPTPGAANAQAYTAPTPVVTASEPRGYRSNPFTVTLTCPNPTAPIRYTLDGSEPGPGSTLFTGPVKISHTTILRAAVVDPATIRQNVTTATWLFLEDVLHQGTTPPPGWPGSWEVNGHVMEYGMRQEIVTGDGDRLRDGMTNSIPSISLVTDPGNLFNAQRGIYVNPDNDGIAWERPVSVELIDPLHGSSSEFQIDAGLRIRGAYSRSSSNPKHSFRLFFRSEYGAGKLHFPLFGDEGAPEFDKVDLRTSQNYSWAYEDSNQDTFVRETFSRDSQRDMGMPYTRSRYYHLYLNGQYWGLYQTQERGDADFAESYLGGSSEDWDCIKTSQPGYTTTASDGTFTAFYALHDLALNQGFAGANANNYYRVKGLNPDGTRNPNSPILLDEDNLIVYMLVAYYTGDPDSPVSMWGGFPNNLYGLFNRAEPTGFKWLRHDAEHSLGAHSSYGVFADTTAAGANFTTRDRFNPATLHLRLCEHPEYRRRFADLAQKHLYGDGALTPENAQARFRSRMDEIDLAIIGESARWGRGKTRDNTWLPTCNSVLNSYLGQRREIVIGQFRNRGWFPEIDAPQYSLMNGEVPPGQSVRLSGSGAFYYTLDGSDPRLPDGTIHPSAVRVGSADLPTGPRTLIRRGADWRYFDRGSEPPPAGQLAWRDPGYPDAAWAHGPAILGFPSAGANPVATQTRRRVGGPRTAQVTTTYFRHTFTLTSTEAMETLVLEILRDDGAVVYLNGVEVAEWRENMPSGAVSYGTFAASGMGDPEQSTYFARSANVGSLLRAGTNTVAVEVHQANATSSDLYFDLALRVPGEVVQVVADLLVTNDCVVKARGFDGGEWSALSENVFRVQRPPMDYAALRISELMYAPPQPEPGSPYTNDDFAWLELCNTGVNPLDLEGVSFDNGINHTFQPLLLRPGERLALVRDLEAFATLYPTNGILALPWTGGALARGGETLSLKAPGGSNILTFAYTKTWYPDTFNTGRSLVAVDLAAPEPLWNTPGQWRPSQVLHGTPGQPELPTLANPRLSAAGLLLVDASGVENSAALWFSEDLNTWKPCDPDAWSRTNDLISVNVNHPSLVASPHCFFQIRSGD